MRIEVNGTGIELRDHGRGTCVLFVHGWPDTGDLWRHQVPVLVDAGYRVLAPDLRGFGASDKPTEVDGYGIVNLLADLVGVLDHAGVGRAHVVGHDWGAALGWMLAALNPDRVASLTALSVGHPAAFRTAGLEQRAKSWYMLLFQFPGIAERWLADDDFANLRHWSRHPDIDEVTARFADPAALTASLDIYRANVPPETLVNPPLELPPILCPTLGVWSNGDIALTEGQMTASADFVKAPWRYERIDGAGHWMQLDDPHLINRLLLDHLRTASS